MLRCSQLVTVGARYVVVIAGIVSLLACDNNGARGDNCRGLGAQSSVNEIELHGADRSGVVSGLSLATYGDIAIANNNEVGVGHISRGYGAGSTHFCVGQVAVADGDAILSSISQLGVCGGSPAGVLRLCKVDTPWPTAPSGCDQEGRHSLSGTVGTAQIDVGTRATVLAETPAALAIPVSDEGGVVVLSRSGDQPGWIALPGASGTRILCVLRATFVTGASGTSGNRAYDLEVADLDTCPGAALAGSVTICDSP